MPNSRILRERVAGQSAMCDVVRAQAASPERSAVERVLGFNPLTSASRAMYGGALAELLVGDVLANLGPRWDVLHDLPLGHTALDHLVIGPAGVFTVRAANYGAQDVIIDGSALIVAKEARDDITRAAAEAAEVERILAAATGGPVAVRALLVIVDPKRLTVKQTASTVRVMASWELERVLTRAARTLTGDEVARLSDVADLVTTWPRADAVDLADTQQLYRDFSAVRDEVRVALGRRILWIVVGLGLVYGAVWALIGTLASLVLATR
ncbi:MAG: hypothetical protein JWP85_821 [Rhodoglobus sp.]|nr:hypothetical protein [Rhodoglobus sp.]